MRVILASASPRRRELLEQVGLEFEVIPAEGEETGTALEPWELVEELASRKAEEVFKKLQASSAAADGDFVVLGADTVVALDGKILGKPENEERAFQMLSCLQGSKHQVYSGVAIYYGFGADVSAARGGDVDCMGESGQQKKCFHVMTEVEVFPMTEAQITAYIATGEPMDKAGAYGIQGLFARYIKGIAGDYYNVVGLPVSRVMQALFSGE